MEKTFVCHCVQFSFQDGFIVKILDETSVKKGCSTDIIAASSVIVLRFYTPGTFENDMAFINRKQFYPINVQGVCDSDAFITNILARWPRSTHDSRIFENSRKAEELREGIIDSVRSKRSRTKSFRA